LKATLLTKTETKHVGALTDTNIATLKQQKN